MDAAGMIAALVLSEPLESAVERGLVTTDAERDLWHALERDIADIRARGGQVEVPSDGWP